MGKQRRLCKSSTGSLLQEIRDPHELFHRSTFLTGLLHQLTYIGACVTSNSTKSQLCQYLSAVLGYNKIKLKQHCKGNIQIKSTLIIIIKKTLLYLFSKQEFFICLGNTEKDMATLATCRIMFALIFQNCRVVLPVNYPLKEMSGGLI